MSAPAVVLELYGWCPLATKLRLMGGYWKGDKNGNYTMCISGTAKLELLTDGKKGLFVQAAGPGAPASSLTTVMRGTSPHAMPVQIAGVEVKGLRAQFFHMPDCGWEGVAEGMALKLGDTGLELLINKNAPNRICVRQSPPRVDPFNVPTPPQVAAKKFCSKCGTPVGRNGAAHCGRCGAKLLV